MNPKLEVRSLRDQPEVCHGGCNIPLGTHRTVTVDSHGNPIRFGDDCGCFRIWIERNPTGFLRRANNALVPQTPTG